MSKKILTYPTFCAAGEAAVAAIGRRAVDLRVKHILIVPDKYTLYYEKRLFTGGGAFDVEVLTLNRLFQRVGADEGSYLSRQGAIMLLRGIVSENAERLTCFRRSAQFKGFAEKLYNVFSQLVTSAVDIDSLTAPGALGMKLDDIRLLYKIYREKTAGRYTDASGRLELLQKHADCPYIRSAVLYFVGHYGVTRQTEEVIDALASHAIDCTVYDCQPVCDRMAGFTVYRAPDNVTAVKAVARRINALANAGAQYGDMCVVTAGGEREIKRIFTEHEIPHFTDSTAKLSAHPLAGFVLTALDCVLRGYRRRDMIRLAKNPCAGIDRRDADQLENRSNERLVDYLGFFRPFDDFDGSNCEGAERARKKLQDTLTPFGAAVRAADGPQAFVRAVNDLLATADCADEQARDKIAGLLEQLSALLPSRCPIQLLTDCLTEGLSVATIGALPQYANTVTVGPPAVFRGQKYAHTFIIGFNDGVLPAYVDDAGLLSDAECETLQRNIAPTTAEINVRAAEELKQIAVTAEDLFVTYNDGSGEHPSGVLTALVGLAAASGNRVTEISAEQEKNAFLYETKDRLNALTAAYCADRASALELLITGLRTGVKTVSSIAAAVEGAERYMNPPVPAADIVESKNLYFLGGKVGVTQLDTYFGCPRLHFYRYGLRLVPPKTGEINRLDVGNLLHETAERFARLPEAQRTEQRVRDIVRSVMAREPKYRLERNAKYAERLTEEAVRLCAVLGEQLSAGAYRVEATEAEFGEGKRYPGIILSDNPPVLLAGKIDRVDAGDGFVRVVDYKTGGKKFDPAAVYYGTQLQLPVYLTAVTAVADGRRPGGMFYFPFKVKWKDPDLRLDGLFDASPESVIAHDRAFAEPGKHESSVIKYTATNKDGALAGYSNKNVADGGLLADVCAYAVAAAGQAVREIADGYIRPTPLVDGALSPCNYCEFAAMCGERFPRYAGSPGTDVFRGEDHGE